MKLRIRGNSIRLRLTKGEIALLGDTGRVAASTDFGAEWPVFKYELRTDEETEGVRALFDRNTIRILLSVSAATAWIKSETVGIESTQQTSANSFLRLLIEKDFKCLSPRDGEDESDTFENPGVLVQCN